MTEAERNRIEGVINDLAEGANITTKPEGFDSLIPEKEFEALIDVYRSYKRLIKVHGECSEEFGDMLDTQTDPYSRLQLLFYLDTLDDLREAVMKAVHIHDIVSKEKIDEVAKNRTSQFRIYLRLQC